MKILDQLAEEGLLWLAYVTCGLILVALVVSIVLCFEEKHRGSRYRFFYSSFMALFISITLLEAIYFYLKYLSFGIAVTITLVDLLAVGVVLYLRKLAIEGVSWAWVTLSLPLLGGWTIPVFLWNLYYAFGLRKRQGDAPNGK